MVERAWYNGYTPKERDKNFKELKQLIASGKLIPATPPCALCGDPGGKVEGHADYDVSFEYHNEDYSLPIELPPITPALVVLCRHCHRNKLHKRFSDNFARQTFLAHIRRGGYARDLKILSINNELKAHRASIELGKTFPLRKLGPYKGIMGSEWFANLRMDVESLKDPSARPRP